MKKILLLNPPGKKLYIRDYYCSKVSKANYVNHPIDLLVLSGRLSDKHNVVFLDAIMEKLSPQAAIQNIVRMNLDVIISLIGSASLDEDIPFLKELKLRQPNLVLLCCGDIVLDRAEEKLVKYDFIDGFILDFSSPDIMEFIDGNLDKVQNMIFRKGDEIYASPLKRENNIMFDLPCPRHDLFLRYDYGSPFVLHKKFATVLTDFGCPFNCTFCIIGTLGYKYRSVENIMVELNYLHSLGAKELFFADQSFGVQRQRNKDLCLNMIKGGFNFSWLCFSRVDLMDEEFLSLMKRSGCHTIIFGVETANEDLLKQYRKNYTREQVKNTFALCRKIGITTVGTFLLGLPEETEESTWGTINFAIEIKADYASFNVAVPREGTGLRDKAIQAGLINADFEVMDQSGMTVAMPTRHISKQRLSEIKKEAVRRFYFRPSYLINRLLSIRSFTRLIIELKNGWALFKINLK